MIQRALGAHVWGQTELKSGLWSPGHVGAPARNRLSGRCNGGPCPGRLSPEEVEPGLRPELLKMPADPLWERTPYANVSAFQKFLPPSDPPSCVDVWAHCPCSRGVVQSGPEVLARRSTQTAKVRKEKPQPPYVLRRKWPGVSPQAATPGDATARRPPPRSPPPRVPAAPARLRHLLLLLVGLLLVALRQVPPGQDGLLVAEFPLQPAALARGQLLCPVLRPHLPLPLEELGEVPGPIHKLIHPGESGQEWGPCWPRGWGRTGSLGVLASRARGAIRPTWAIAPARHPPPTWPWPLSPPFGHPFVYPPVCPPVHPLIHPVSHPHSHPQHNSWGKHRGRGAGGRRGPSGGSEGKVTLGEVWAGPAFC